MGKFADAEGTDAESGHVHRKKQTQKVDMSTQSGTAQTRCSKGEGTRCLVHKGFVKSCLQGQRRIYIKKIYFLKSRFYFF